MNSKAIEHANIKLEQAQGALEILRSSTEFVDTERAWSAFIMSLGTIYTKLEQGAKADPKSMAWFSEVKRERKRDSLLQYLHQARNAEEHGIEDITTRNSRQIAQTIRLPNGKTAELKIQVPSGHGNFGLSESPLQKSFLGGQFIRDAVALVPVSNRGVTYPVPAEHQNQAFGAVGVLPVAEAGFAYAKRLIAAARLL